jgi:hypothetical protein
MATAIQQGVISPIVAGNAYSQLSASTLLHSGEGFLTGIFVSAASSSPSIKIWDNTSAAGSILVDTFTPFAGSWYPLPFHYQTGLYITISGTVSATVSFT